jgi:sphingosine kinase
MMSRPDWKDLADSLVFGFIPAGTGNGLVKSVSAVRDKEPGDNHYSIECAAMTIVKGEKMGLDLTEIQLEYQPEKKIYMFLSLSWGYIADVDINSESIRWAGPTRMTIWGIYRLADRKSYEGEFLYKGRQVNEKNDCTDFTNHPPILKSIDSYFSHLIV